MTLESGLKKRVGGGNESVGVAMDFERRKQGRERGGRGKMEGKRGRCAQRPACSSGGINYMAALAV